MPPTPQMIKIAPLALLPGGTLVRLDAVQFASWDERTQSLLMIIATHPEAVRIGGEDAKEIHSLLQLVAGIEKNPPGPRLAVPETPKLVMP